MIITFQVSRRILLLGVGGFVGALLLLIGLVSAFLFRYDEKIFPLVQIVGVDVGGLTKPQAYDLIQQSIKDYQQEWPMQFVNNGQIVEIELPETAVSYSIATSIDHAYSIGRRVSWQGFQELANLSQEIIQVPLDSSVDIDWLQTTAASISAQVDVPVIPTHLEVKTNGDGTMSVEAIAGQGGKILNQDLWIDSVHQGLVTLTRPNNVLAMEEQYPQVTQDQISSAVMRANYLLPTTLRLSLDPQDVSEKSWELTGPDLVKFVTFDDGYDKELISEYVMGVASAVDQPPKDAKFQFDEATGKVDEFVPAEDGVVVVVSETVDAIAKALETLGNNQVTETIQIPVKTQPPSITLGEVNQLGIREKLGVGVSTYKGSILSRVHNVELAARRLNGVLIKPGEEFSFNAAVGEVSAATGYQSAYIIRDGRTQLGDGGGLCQDSTTVFRAALDTGLPITVRRGHSYRVGYYEQNAKAGLDATVYSPSTDLKFINDTPAHILIQTKVDSPNRELQVIFYGTSDGRKATIKDHVVWGITPALPDVFQDDPTLPVGVVKQVDWKAAGAKAKFTYLVERNGQVIHEKTFVTNFQPWAAVFLRGTKQ